MARRKRRYGLRGTDYAKRTTRYAQLQREARAKGLFVTRYRPGDGVARYRFFDKPGNDYFGPDNDICTALGLKAAKHYLATGSCPRGRK